MAMPPNPESSLTQEQQAKLAHIKRDIVQTVRQVVEVVSKYAGGSSLPEPARQRVKKFVLTLPRRWAERGGGGGSSDACGPGSPEQRQTTTGTASPAAGTTVNGTDKERESVAAAASGRAGSERRHHHHYERHRERGVRSSTTSSPSSSRAPSPNRSPRLSRASRPGQPTAAPPGGTAEVPVPAHSAMRATQRVLNLAVESLDMMRGVTGVVKDSLDRADAWVGRLKYVGVHRGPNGQDEVIVERADEEAAAEAGMDTQEEQVKSAPANSEGGEKEYGYGYGYGYGYISSTSAPPSSSRAYRDHGDDWETRSNTTTTLSHSRNVSADYFLSSTSPYTSSSRSSLPGTPGPSGGDTTPALGAGMKQMTIGEVIERELQKKQTQEQSQADATDNNDADADVGSISATTQDVQMDSAEARRRKRLSTSMDVDG